MINIARRKCILVLGMHRSGTSALAGSMHKLGVTLGSELLEPSFDNADGFFEHKCVVSLNDRLLSFLGGSWIEPPCLSADWWLHEELAAFRGEARAILELDFHGQALFAIKDPRLCLLLPFWIHVLQSLRIDPLAIHLVRAPEEVADSLFRRDQLPPHVAVGLWERYVSDAERDGAPIIRSRCTFDELLSSPAAVLQRLERELDIQWPIDALSIQDKLSQFVAPGKRHQVRHPSANLPEHFTALYESVQLGRATFPPVTRRPERTQTTPDTGLPERLFPRAARLAVVGTAAEGLTAYVGNLAAREVELEESARTYHRRLAEVRIESDSQEAAGIQRLCATVYWDDGVHGYAEAYSTRKHAQLGMSDEPTVLQFDLDTTGVTALRFDPMTRPGAIALTRISLLSTDGKLLWTWSGDRNAVSGSNQIVLLDNPDASGLTIFSTGYDPYLEFSLPETISSVSGLILRADISGSPTAIQSATSRLSARGAASSAAQPVPTIVRSCATDVLQQVAELGAGTQAVANLVEEMGSLSLVCEQTRELGLQTKQAIDQLVEQQSAWLTVAAGRQADLDHARVRTSQLEQEVRMLAADLKRADGELASASIRIAELNAALRETEAHLKRTEAEVVAANVSLSVRDSALQDTRTALAAREGELATLQEELALAKQAFNAIHQSIWWKSTGPLRTLTATLGRIIKRRGGHSP